MEIITSPQNHQIKNIIKLRKASERGRRGLIIIEGHRELSLALAGGVKIENLFYCQELAAGKNVPVGVKKEGIIGVFAEVFKKISYRENPDGFLALAKSKYLKLEDIKLSKNPLLVILEAVEKPGNLGAILRSADAAGVDAVIITDSKTDIYNPNAIRVSQGTVFTNQVVVCEISEAIKWLKEKKIKNFATTPAAKKVYTTVDFSGPAAIVMGAEDVGLSKKWLAAADEKIKIPMRGKINSLNVSVSAAIILFEAVRQRTLSL